MDKVLSSYDGCQSICRGNDSGARTDDWPEFNDNENSLIVTHPPLFLISSLTSCGGWRRLQFC